MNWVLWNNNQIKKNYNIIYVSVNVTVLHKYIYIYIYIYNSNKYGSVNVTIL